MSADALGRSRLAVLLGRLLLDGFTDDVLPVVAALPALGDAVVDLSADERAVRREALWGRWVSPHASAFLSIDGRLGGPVADGVRRSFRAVGYAPTRLDAEVDHVGMLALFLGGLHRLEHNEVRQAFERDLFRPFLAALSPTVVAAGFAEWTAVVELLHALVGEGEVADLPPPPSLDDPGLGWKRIAGRWTIPVAIGGWLTPAHIDGLADAAGVPRGFGSRRSRTEKVTMAALDQGRMSELLGELARVTSSWAAGPAPWADRAGAARATLTAMREQVAARAIV